MTYLVGFVGELAAAINHARNHGAPPDSLVKLNELYERVYSAPPPPAVSGIPERPHPPIPTTAAPAPRPVPNQAAVAKDLEERKLPPSGVSVASKPK